MKRIYVLFIAFLFLIPPLAVAEADDSAGTDAVAVATKDSDRSLRPVATDDTEKPEPTLIAANRMVKTSEVQYRVRTVAVATQDEQMKLYRTRTLAYNTNREEYEQERLIAFRQAKRLYAECTGDCEELRTRAMEAAKNSMQGALDSAIEYLEGLKARAEGADSVTDDDLQGIVVLCDRLINAAKGLKTEVDDAETAAEIKTAARKVGVTISKVRAHTMWIKNRVQGQHQYQNLRKAEHLGDKLECAKQQGLDLDTSEYEAVLEQARTALEEARRLQGDGEFAQAARMITQAQTQMNKALTLAKRYMTQLREQGVELPDCDVEDSGEDELFEEDVATDEAEADEEVEE